MINGVTIRGVEFHEGMPKICAILIGFNFDVVLENYREIKDMDADLFEWRVDALAMGGYKDVESINRVLETIRKEEEETREVARPIILTLRTKEEGGACDLPAREYFDVVRNYIAEVDVDLVDIEAFGHSLEEDDSEELVAFLTHMAKENDKKIILSNHDFSKTPATEEIVARLKKMESLGADIPKVAYMPMNDDDVHNLLEAAATAQEELSTPFVTLSMGDLGKTTRICAGMFGSCITFGATAKGASAPGQINIEELRGYLEEYYGSNN